MHRFLHDYKIELRLGIVLLVICIALSFMSDSFFTLSNLTSLLNNNAINLIWAVGLLVVLIAGGIDISFAVASSVVQYVAVQMLFALGGGNWLVGIIVVRRPRHRSGLINMCADPHLPHRDDRCDHRHLQRLLRPSDVLHQGAEPLRSARLDDRPHLDFRDTHRPTAHGRNSILPSRSWSFASLPPGS